ncbi:unnamed protein product [Pleuronectes platessa]|uniref:5-hydroxytryptamine receptor 2A n=1 Tax=Pleuronectes platessa TaxID=8262 RepID=A0A9N7YAD6_PLEPL|nr:unnamed protein product [Pleuronectes platessa]
MSAWRAADPALRPNTPHHHAAHACRQILVAFGFWGECLIWFVLVFVRRDTWGRGALCVDVSSSQEPPLPHGLRLFVFFTFTPQSSSSQSLLGSVHSWISMPIPVLGLRDHSKVFKDGSCFLTDNHFVLVGSFVAFFVPLTIMVVTYFLTINALQNEATLCLDQLVPRPKWSTTFTLSFLPQTSLSSERLFRRSLSREAGGRGSGGGLGGGGLGGGGLGGGGLGGERGSVSGSLLGRRTMQSISNEQKASKVLGVVFFLFVVMWCPFFITNVLVVVCDPEACDPGLMGGLLNVFVWVGYLSSAVNPLVYTLFNKTYRAAFLRYVRCQYQPLKKPLQLMLVNTIPPLAFSSSHLPLGDIAKLRNGAALSSGGGRDFSLPGQEILSSSTSLGPSGGSARMGLDLLLDQTSVLETWIWRNQRTSPSCCCVF